MLQVLVRYLSKFCCRKETWGYAKVIHKKEKKQKKELRKNGQVPKISKTKPTTKAYVEFIGREKVRAYLQCIYCKVKQRIQRELSHTIKSRCACVCGYVVDIYGG